MPLSSDYVAASNGDGEAVRAIVVSERTVGSLDINADSVLNWPNKFIATSGDLDPVTGIMDESTLTVFKGTLTGSIIHIDEFAPGYPDVGNTPGQVVVVKPSTLWADIVRDYLDELTAFAEASTHVALVKNEVVLGVKDGVNTEFTIAGEAITSTVELYKNGVRQNPGLGNDYSVSGSNITMAVAPLAGTILLADYATTTTQFTNPSYTGLRMNQVPTGVVDGSNAVFTTLTSYMPGTLEVWINGLKQLPGTHFSETTPGSGVFTMSDAPLTGDNILVNYHHTLSAGLGDADTVDTYHASTTPMVNTLLPLNGSAKYPVTTVETLSEPDSDWIDVTFQNGWTDYPAPWPTTQYYKDSLGFVHLKGMPRSGTMATAAFTLPVGYRPGEQGIYTVTMNNAWGQVRIYTNGQVIPHQGSNTWCSLDGITFKAEL